MKKLAFILLSLFSFSALSSDRVMRLDEHTLTEISTEISCHDRGNVYDPTTKYKTEHKVFITTSEGERIFLISDYTMSSKCSDFYNQVASGKNGDFLIGLHRLKNGAIDLIEKNDDFVCVRKILYIVLNAKNERTTLSWEREAVPCK